jgi:hypothetical protein
MKPKWFCLLYKALNIVFDVSVGSNCWLLSNMEPLLLGSVERIENGCAAYFAQIFTGVSNIMLHASRCGRVRECCTLIQSVLFHIKSQEEEEEERENDPQLQQRMRSEWGTSTNLPMISGLGKMAITS